MAEYGEQLLANGYVESLPDGVQFIRYVSVGEWAQVRATCLQDLGFRAEAHPDGGFETAVVPEDQQPALHEALYRCEGMYPLHPQYSLPFDDTQLVALYHYLTNDTAVCLRAEGYEVQEAPSVETFIAQYRHPDDYSDGPWSPYRGVLPGSEEEWLRINETCPQHAPLELLYGDTLPEQAPSSNRGGVGGD